MAPFGARINHDVLQEIFLAAAGRFELGGSELVVGAEDWLQCFPQFLVSRVCSSWRHIALHTPQLWDRIAITKITDAQFEIAREYLSRAKSQPVSVCINFHLHWEYNRDRLSQQLTDFLSSYQLRALDVVLLDTETSTKFYHILPNLHQWNVVNLKSLTIKDYLRPKISSKVSALSGLGTSLRELNGKNLVLTVTEAWELLSHCPSLEFFRFSFTQDNNAKKPKPLPLIRLQHLHTLMSDYRHSEETETPFSTFIEALSIPVMTDLIIFGGPIEWSSTAFQSFALRSDYFLHLQNIDMWNPGPAIDVGVLLGSTPSLKKMCLYGANNVVILDRDVLDGLASGLLGPRLNTVNVACIRNQEEFMDMVESRMKNASMSSNGVPAPFKKVEFRTVLDNCDTVRLDTMRQRGITIYGSY